LQDVENGLSRRRRIPLATHEEISKSGLSGAVRAEERMDFSRLDREVESIKNLLIAHPKGKIANV
jgi:hypothetical protein